MRWLLWTSLLAACLSVSVGQGPCTSGEHVGQCVPTSDCKKGNKLNTKCPAMDKLCGGGSSCCFRKKKKPPKSVCDEPEPDTPPPSTPEEELRKLKQKIKDAKNKLGVSLRRKFDPVITFPKELNDSLKELWILTGSATVPQVVVTGPDSAVPAVNATADRLAGSVPRGGREARSALEGPPNGRNRGELKKSDIETLKKEIMEELQSMSTATKSTQASIHGGPTEPGEILCDITIPLKKYLWDAMERIQKLRGKYRDMLPQIAIKAFLHPKWAEWLKKWIEEQFETLDRWEMALMDMAKCYMQYLLDSCCDVTSDQNSDKGWK